MGSMIAGGYVDADLIGPDGTSSKAVEGSNTLLYWCADAVAHMFAGGTDYMPATIGFICSPVSSGDASTGHFNFNENDRTTKSQDELVDTKAPSTLVVRDVSIGQNKQFSKTADGYTGNKVTLGAMTTENDKAEDIYGLLLKDVRGRVIAVKKFSSKVTRVKDYAFSVSWSVTFN